MAHRESGGWKCYGHSEVYCVPGRGDEAFVIQGKKGFVPRCELGVRGLCT